jgi:hypothetical protein
MSGQEAVVNTTMCNIEAGETRDRRNKKLHTLSFKVKKPYAKRFRLNLMINLATEPRLDDMCGAERRRRIPSTQPPRALQGPAQMDLSQDIPFALSGSMTTNPSSALNELLDMPGGNPDYDYAWTAPSPVTAVITMSDKRREVEPSCLKITYDVSAQDALEVLRRAREEGRPAVAAYNSE